MRVWWPPTDDNKRSGYRSARLTSTYLVFIARLLTEAATVDAELAEHVCTLGINLSAEFMCLQWDVLASTSPAGDSRAIARQI